MHIYIPSSSSFVRLTKVNSSDEPTTESIGRLLHSPPVKFWDEGLQATFETLIRFTIRPSRDFPNPPGAGLTFFIVPVNSTIPPGSTGGNLGLFDPQTGLAPSVFAVEFDPALDWWDPSYQHIGIDINSRASRNVSAIPVVGHLVTAHITYVPSTRTISVVANYGGSQVVSILTYVFDLKTILPKEVQVGISATTGSSVAVHDLLYWYFTSTLVTDKTYIQQYVS